MISIPEILKHLESGKPFSCRVISFDQKRGTGGKIKFYEEAKLVQKEEVPTEKAGRPLTAFEQKQAKIEVLKKNPNHRKWYTRNIRILHNGLETMEIKKIHPPLIIEFNGQKVTP